MTIPMIFGLHGTRLTEAEKILFNRAKPSGYILFSRNISDIPQLKELVNQLKEVSGDNIDIYIDQEGGRVARLKPPLFRKCPPAYSFTELAENSTLEDGLKALYDNYYNITKDLLDIGINVNCVPCADLQFDGADIIIGDRSFGTDPEVVTEFCSIVMKAVKDAGGKYIIKHIPGHGRAKVDSHLALPTIDESLDELKSTDFKVFKNLSNQGADMAMTAHIVFNCLDNKNPVTLSPNAIKYIRQELGFKGILISDDINMKALNGDLAEIAIKAIDSGCDLVLHCNGDLNEMTHICEAFLNNNTQTENFKEKTMLRMYSKAANQQGYPFKLPTLPYDKEAFMPKISPETFEYHHGKHHNTYVVNLNTLLEKSDMKNMWLEEIMEKTHNNNEQISIYNNAAQIWNHSFFWHCMTPHGGGKPTGDLLFQIEKDFGGFDTFREQFKHACLTQFGSGWGWLVMENGKMKVVKTANAENPFHKGQFPLLTCDVWEHAYYIDFRNNRASFVDTFLDQLINWSFVSLNYSNALSM
jgi:superoxide dismutase